MDAATSGFDDRPLTLPPAVPQQQAAPFPFAACVAPLVASGLIWAITQSPFALVFAALSPVIAVASVVDGRWHARAARRRARAAQAAARAKLETDVVQRHERERAVRFSRTPTARQAMHATGRIGRWNTDRDSFAFVTIGTGDMPSSLRLGGEAGTADDQQLLARSATLDDSPVIADATLGIGLVGPPTLIRAVARGYLVQLVHAFSPQVARIAQLPSAGWEWATELPHRSVAGDDGDDVGARIFVHSTCVNDTIANRAAASSTVGRRAADAAVLGVRAGPRRGRDAVIALAGSVEELQTPCAIVIEVTGPCSARVLRNPQGLPRNAVVPELIAEAHAAGYARRLAEHAAVTGLARMHRELPSVVAFGDLDRLPVQATGASLVAAVGQSRDGVLTLDLVADGPHAVVGGTTGSGKSEFLTAWVAAMATQYSPQAVGFLLVDFKGGSAFTALARLPHCVGLITDLGHGEAERALKSLLAELQHRERVLARLGARDIGESAGELGRLVIVVDEFAAMLEMFPELHAVFVDIAARGRSLGVHAVLCTQRPAGVVRDSLLANCALRISLRVNNAVDSVAVVGTDAASRFTAAQPGRCVVARDGATEQAQLARASVADIDRIVQSHSWSGVAGPRRPWLDRLPGVIPLETLDRGSTAGVILGVEDVPSEQRQSAVAVQLAGSHLLVHGVHGAGKSTTLISIARQWPGEVRTTQTGIEALWDALAWADDRCAPTGRGPLEPNSEEHAAVLLIDDLDAVLGRMPQVYHDLALERLVRILRDGPALGISVVAAVQTVTAALRSAAALFPDVVLLRQSNRQDHVLAGAPAELYDERAQPGAGVWRGNRIQLVWPENERAQKVRSGRRAAQVDPDGRNQPPVVRWGDDMTIVVTRSPAARIRSLRDHAAGLSAGVIEVVDLDAVADRVGDSGAATSGALRILDGSEPAIRSILLGSPDGWQARWSLFSAMRGRCTVVFDGCSVAQLRALLQTREVPPLIA
ncbi:MAG TPA: FtsK/SpoIIIE domain-containing protein, partial [Microbacteriaceae bacterium]